MVCGHGKHGKDAFCEMLMTKVGTTTYPYPRLRYNPSSLILAPLVFESLREKYNYSSPEECWGDRRNHRSEWFEIIREYNSEGPRTGREIFAKNDVYCGCRNIDEFNAMKEERLFDVSVWVDASLRLPNVVDSDCSITRDDCDVVVDNNGTLEDLEMRVDEFVRKLRL